MTPVCLITDRRRFGAAWEPALVERVRAARAAGVHLIQVRERDLDGGRWPASPNGASTPSAGHGRACWSTTASTSRWPPARTACIFAGDSMDAARVRRIVPPGS